MSVHKKKLQPPGATSNDHQLDLFKKLPWQDSAEREEKRQWERLGLRGNVFEAPEGSGRMEILKREMRKLAGHRWVVICGSSDEARRLNIEFWGEEWAGMRKPTAVSDSEVAKNTAPNAIAIIAPDRKNMEYAKMIAELNRLSIEHPKRLENARNMPGWMPVLIITPSSPEAKRHYDNLMDSVFGPIDNSILF